jgi:hypothetical protein
MSNAYINEPYRIHYIAKEYRAGLTDIHAHVYKPNGLLLGPYYFIEVPPSPSVEGGVYFLDFMDSDSEGNYLFLVHCPSQEARAAQQVFFVKRPDIDVKSIKLKTDRLTFNDNSSVKSYISDSPAVVVDSEFVDIRGPYQTGMVDINKTFIQFNNYVAYNVPMSIAISLIQKSNKYTII